MEWVWFEHLGADMGELFAAPGSHTGFSTAFKPVGHPALFAAGANQVPEARADFLHPPPGTTEGFSFAVLTNDTDADLDALAIVATTNGSRGTVTTGGAGLTYVPAAGYDGNDVFTYTVSDGRGGFATGYVALHNAAPVGVPDEVVLSGHGLVPIAAQANDTDADGDSLVLVSVTPPQHGTATVNLVQGSVDYDPDDFYGGTDSFTYTVSDRRGLLATATVTLTVPAPSPLQSWRCTYFGTTANSGNAADSADPDLDNTINLLEFAFGTDPTVAQSGVIVVSGATIVERGTPTVWLQNLTYGVDYRALFGRRKDYLAAGLTYTVQFSAELSPSGWENSEATPTVIASDAEIDAVTVPYPFFLSTGQKAQFFRVQVSMP